MIEIKCGKAQFNRIVEAMIESSLHEEKCVLGKTAYTCPAVGDNFSSLTCDKCIRAKVLRVES